MKKKKEKTIEEKKRCKHEWVLFDYWYSDDDECWILKFYCKFCRKVVTDTA